jgi:predicted secreted Zn-dependent protease
LRNIAIYGALALSLCFPPSAVLAQDWQPVEKIQTYSVRGETGLDLYRSIGDRGPESGVTRAIAVTSFKLTWTRKYDPQPDGRCVLTVARPKLIITTVLPKPASRLPSGLAAAWKTFIDGVAAHEKVHAQMITDMVREIEAMSVGFSAPDDPKCSQIRKDLTKRLGEISMAQRARSRDFDRVELSEGGNVHQLVLQLVNTR